MKVLGFLFLVVLIALAIILVCERLLAIAIAVQRMSRGERIAGAVVFLVATLIAWHLVSTPVHHYRY
jgi:hypothetical protein